MITAAQLRAARALLDWTRSDLAKAASISPETIKNIEHGTFRPQEVTSEAIIRAFASHGVEFTGNEGVQLRRDSVTRQEGTEGFKRFLDDVYLAAQQPYSFDGGAKALCVTAIGDVDFSKHLGDFFAQHVRRMNEIKNLKMLILLKEKPTTKTSEEKRGSYREYRFRSQGDNANASFYVYGDKLAILDFERVENSPQIVVISSALAAKAYREQFDAMWRTATPVDA